MPAQNNSSILIRKPFENSGIETLEPMVLLSACGLKGDIQKFDSAIESCEVDEVSGHKFWAYPEVAKSDGKFSHSDLIDFDSCKVKDKHVPDPYLSKGGCSSGKGPSEPWDVVGDKAKQCGVKMDGLKWGGEESTHGKLSGGKSCGEKVPWGGAGYGVSHGSVAPSFNWSGNAESKCLGDTYVDSVDSRYDAKMDGIKWGGEESTHGKFAGGKSCGGKVPWGSAGYGVSHGSVAPSFNWSGNAESKCLGDTYADSADSRYDAKMDSLNISVNASAQASITISGLGSSSITIVASADASAKSYATPTSSSICDSSNDSRSYTDSSADSAKACDAILVSCSKDVDDGEFRAIDGYGNNLLNPHFGATHTELIRLVPGDGVVSPSYPFDGVIGDGLPSAREVSNIVNDQDVSILNDRGTSDYLWAWGQFVDHDITLTEAGAVNGEKAPIAVPLGDPEFDPHGTGTATIDFTRSDYRIDDNGVRQFENEITAFIDGSQVYGSDNETASLLRDGAAGKLRVSEGNLLPFGETNGEAIDDIGGKSFIAGDVRANENAALTSLHTLFVREHNRLAEEIAAKDYAYADLSDAVIDEQIYQKARVLVSAQLQHITYDEFLPALLGKDAIGEYKGYDVSIDPSIANEFSTAAFRIGHTMLSDSIQRLDESGHEIAEGNLELRDAFFRPDKVAEAGIDPILRGLAAQASQEVDPYLVDDVRNFLFGAPGSGGLDLASLNLQRGRDHGLPSYVDARAALGLTEVCDFSDISSDPEVVSRLQEAYGTVDKVDFWVGGLAEDHVHGSSTGELFSKVIADQFIRLRDGDRFYFENSLSTSEIAWVESRKLSDVVRDNTAVEKLAENVFFVEGKGNRYV